MKELNEELNIYSEEVKDVLSKPPKIIFRWGNTMLFGFICIILFLSWLIKYPDTVSAQALLTTEIPPQKEYARVTGKIDSIFVENFQEVKKETPLALIENTANYKDIVYLKSILDTLEVDQSSFYFPLEELPMLFLGDLEDEFTLFENNYIQYELNKESQSFLSSDLANKYTLSQLNHRLSTLYNQRDLNKEELIFKKKDLERNEKLFEKGVISAQEIENKKLEYIQAERNYKNMSVSISQIKENISNTKNVKKQNLIDNKRQEVNLLKSVIQSLDQLKRAIKEWELRYLFKSNIKGEVSFMKIWNKNQTINNGDFVFTIIPKNYLSYICKVRAPVLNSGKVKVGQSVNIKLSSYPDNEFGVLKGSIKDISLVPNNEGLYLIDVELPKKLITTHGKKIDFKQEMQGVAEIITEDLRLIERIFYKFKEIFKQ
ncbi:multidrug resistance efflux pump [Mesoflavibacter sabulilitoris]|uniref:HlyD family secretion protein n=1 Tax=Mesoflavibacter zeaxanthinifaciens subsp. sabulilitoris TaxID=1520893 RepID=A0A2T1N5Y9_9FLAO|nr:HlyD family efflux transporter periplasmic adaptor subunit [Mesoflavibacter zeaxanthinifaciens]MBB3123371.1 multidrug resistance efflux pump [Mesoflavibacter zeaxanthinifaciens subsp. sabulilitoris]PSG86997.1 HlyD family secretion protein [Mesoflavibacter zeaxanthinifaciens subsp. sabulilitoris]